MRAPPRKATESAWFDEVNFRVSHEEDAMSISYQVFGDIELKGVVTNAAMERGFSMPLSVSFLRPLRTQNPNILTKEMPSEYFPLCPKERTYHVRSYS